MVWLPVIVPVLGGLCALAARRHRLVARAVVVVGAALTASVAVVGAVVQAQAAWAWTDTVPLAVGIDGFGRIMVVLVPLVATGVIAFASGDGEHDPALIRLLANLSFFIGAMELLVIARDFLTLLIGWELVGATSWLLIGHRWQDPARPRSAREAFVTTRFGDLGLYVAAGATFAATGGVRYADLASASAGWLAVVAGGVILAAAAKSAQVPFSPWLFSAMAGPTPASALLHSATMVAAGAYLLILLGPALGAVGWFAPAVIAIGLATAVAGGLVALAHTDFKKALAGSTSAQYGLMLVAIGAGFGASAGGQLVAHALFKSLLFLGAGVALHARGTLDLGRLRLGRALPRVAGLFAVGALALGAVPPLGGALTKESIVAGAFHSGLWVGVGTLAAGLLSTLYGGRLHLLGFGPGPLEPLEARPRRAEVVGMGLLALATLLLSLVWLPGGENVFAAAMGLGEPAVPSTAEKVLSWALILAAIGAVGLLERHGRLESLGIPQGVRTFLASWWGLPTLARVAVIDPVSSLARLLFAADRGLVARLADGVAGVGQAASRAAAHLMDRAVDAVVMAIGVTTVAGADRSRGFDERVVDGAVEGLAASMGEAGSLSQKTQTGMSYHYYTAIVIGTVIAIGVAALWR